MVHFTATFVAKPGLADRVEELCRSTVAPTAEEPGCLVYELYRSQDEPGRFFYWEIWSDNVALEEHAAKPHITRFLEAIESLLARPAEFVTLDPLNSVERVRSR